MKPTLGRVVHAHGTLFDPTMRVEADVDAWHAAFVVDVRGLVLDATFRANVFRYGGGVVCFDFKLADEGKTWRWPPRETA